jgi:hypothetical protein
MTAAGESQVLLADSHSGDAAVVSHDGELIARFQAGSSIQQVLSNENNLFCTYFDEGVFSGRGPSDEGIAVFSSAGDFITGFHSKFGWNLIGIADCYCACLDPVDRLLFSPYADFPLVRWEVASGEQRVWQLPEELHACSTLSATETHAYFWAPQYEKTNRIFRFGLDSGEVTVVGELAPPKHRQPLSQGRFLAWDNESYFIVHATT